MNLRTLIEKAANELEAWRRRVWARRLESGWHPELGILCPWCKADFCEIDGHDCSTQRLR